ncbi:UNVERIFIED_CONTAM: hypothetical protein GTU68_034035 [Idotea baltica]|nr:hypothetical protein [Idotea baltica]
MGNGIAHVFGLHEYEVILVDISPSQVDKAMTTISKNLDRMLQKGHINSDQKIGTLLSIKTSTDLTSAVVDADLVIEAVSEDIDLKRKLFRELSEHAPSECILASNTSSISITKIAAVTTHPERVIGMHFMNPVPVMKLIEIIKGHRTSPEITRAVVTIGKSLGKVPVEVNDYPGFIANRILMPMINEAIWSLHEGVGTAEAIDSIMKLGMAHPMGPLQLADFIGLDVCYSILKVMQDGFGNQKYAPCPLLVNMVNAGMLGKKTKEGFYEY